MAACTGSRSEPSHGATSKITEMLLRQSSQRSTGSTSAVLNAVNGRP